MKVTNKIYTNLNLAHEDIRSDNFRIDFIWSSIIALCVSYFTFRNFITAILIFISIRFLYYFLFELFLGRTPGKFKTQTLVVNEHGLKASAIQLILRNLIRFLSLISGVSDQERAIHDIYSNTFVVQDLTLKKIDFNVPLSLLLNIFIPAFWVYFILNTNEEFNTLSIILLIIFCISFIYSLGKFIKKVIKIT